MDWLNRGQEQIEKRLFSLRPSQQKPELFFYDLTSSYLEGEPVSYLTSQAAIPKRLPIKGIQLLPSGAL
jgi:hypothetical protein